MRNAVAILKSTQGVFSSAARKIAADNFTVDYVGIVHDKQNLRKDMQNIYSDVRKVTAEAHDKISLPK